MSGGFQWVGLHREKEPESVCLLPSDLLAIPKRRGHKEKCRNPLAGLHPTNKLRGSSCCSLVPPCLFFLRQNEENTSGPCVPVFFATPPLASRRRGVAQSARSLPAMKYAGGGLKASSPPKPGCLDWAEPRTPIKLRLELRTRGLPKMFAGLAHAGCRTSCQTFRGSLKGCTTLRASCAQNLQRSAFGRRGELQQTGQKNRSSWKGF